MRSVCGVEGDRGGGKCVGVHQPQTCCNCDEHERRFIDCISNKSRLPAKPSAKSRSYSTMRQKKIESRRRNQKPENWQTRLGLLSCVSKKKEERRTEGTGGKAPLLFLSFYPPPQCTSTLLLHHFLAMLPRFFFFFDFRRPYLFVFPARRSPRLCGGAPVAAPERRSSSRSIDTRSVSIISLASTAARRRSFVRLISCNWATSASSGRVASPGLGWPPLSCRRGSRSRSRIPGSRAWP